MEEETSKRILHLVFSGSGADFPCFVGVLKSLLTLDPTAYTRLASVTASSGGAIVGLLSVLRCPISFMEHLLYSIEYNKHLQHIDFRTLLTHYGLDDSGGIVKVLKRILTQRVGKADTTFSELHHYTRDVLKRPCTFRVTATDVTKMSLAVFDHINTPDLEVWKAVKITTSIPLVFTSTILNECLYCDGGILAYFPIHLLPPVEMSEQVIGIVLDRGIRPNEVTDLLSFVVALANTVSTYAYDKAKSMWENLAARANVDIICVQTCRSNRTSEKHALDINRSTQEKSDLIDLGYMTAASYFTSETTVVKHVVRDILLRVVNSAEQNSEDCQGCVRQ